MINISVDIVSLSGRPKNKLIQLALPLDKVKQDKLKFPMLWSEKIDGVFCLALKKDNEVSIFSRTGERYVSMRHIEEQLKLLLDEDYIILFEATSYHTKNQATISGWCRDTKKQHPELFAACHTLLTISDFIEGAKKSYEYAIDWEVLKDQIDKYGDKTKVTYIMQQRVDSLEEALQLTKIIWEQGGEGAVLRNPHACYQGGKRNQDIIKIKKGVSYDLKVTGIYPGKGKYQNTTGYLECQFKDGKKLRVGSGLTDNERNLWRENPNEIIGKIVQVDAMTESSKGLLREPRYKGIRHDKTEGDF